MLATFLALIALVLALIPLGLYLANRAEYRPPDVLVPAEGPQPRYEVSVLIPARDEAASIGPCLEAALQSQGVELEVVVMDDHSQDATADIVRDFGQRDSRVQLASSAALPAGWNGKQHACWQLSQRATHSWLVFLDADVRLRPDALRQMIGYAEARQVGLLSAFPHQETGTLLEKMLIPMMHVVLLCFLPLRRMRASTNPAYAAGCGQFFVTSAADYQRAGTHAAIRASRHDGIKLPRAYRAAGLSSDVVDGTPLARCRMYGSGSQVVRGLLKNADEGIANAKLIVPFTVMLLGGAVLPWVLLGVAIWSGIDGQSALGPWTVGIAAAAALAGWLPRLLNALWLRQSWLGAMLHPLAVLVFLTLQWIALLLSCSGRRVAWRGRAGS